MASSVRFSVEGQRLHRLPSAFPQFPSLHRHERRDATSFLMAKRKGDVDEIDEVTRAKRISEKQAAKEAGLVKRKVGMHIGYVGTNYSGLQLSTLDHVKTIEGELQQALLQSGCMTESNAVVAMKCLLEEKRFDEDSEGLELAGQISRYLPENIRVFSVQRVNDGFFARKMCMARSYTYYLPVSVLTGSQDAVSEEVERAHLERFRQALHTYCGRHAFHNYTKRRQYIDNNDPWSYGRRQRRKEKAVNAAPLEEEDALESGEDELRLVPSTGTRAEEFQALVDRERETGRWRFWNFEYKDDIDPNDRVVAPHYRNIMNFTADDPESIIPGGVRAVRCQVHGVSFMLHQIRYMIGAAIAVARELISLSILEASLKACIRINLPLAPPEPLMLTDSEFSPFPANAGEQAVVAKWSGEKLELRSGGQNAQQSFSTDVMLPEIDRLLQLPDWNRWSEVVKMVTYRESIDSDVAQVMQQYNAWVEEKQKIKQAKREALEKELAERGIDRETWLKQRKEKSKRSSP